MGEYALNRKNEEVKIGTCENMYYLRYEQRYDVKPMPGNVDPVKQAHLLHFRLPFPDEDGTPPGEYADFSRCQPLGEVKIDLEPGEIIINHKYGLQIKFPCYHGKQLPKAGGDFTVTSFTAYPYMALVFIKPTPKGVKPVIECLACGSMWLTDWREIWGAIPEGELKERLKKYKEAED